MQHKHKLQMHMNVYLEGFEFHKLKIKEEHFHLLPTILYFELTTLMLRVGDWLIFSQ